MKTRANWLFQLFLATMLAFATIVVVGTGLMIISSIFDPFNPIGERWQLRYAPDGEPYIEHTEQVASGWFSQEVPRVTYTDLDGHPIAAPVDFDGIGLGTSEDPINHATHTARFDRASDDYIETFIVERQTSSNSSRYLNTRSVWYLMSRKRADRSFLVGYDPTTNERIGFIGTAGFRREPAPLEECFAQVQFANPWYTAATATGVRTEGGISESYTAGPYLVVVNCGAQVFGVDLTAQQVKTIYDDPAAPVRDIATRGGEHPVLFALTDEAIYVIAPGGERQTYPLPVELQRRDMTFAPRTDGGLTIKVDRQRKVDSTIEPISIYVLAPDGTVGPARQVDLPIDVSGLDAQLLFLAFASPAMHVFAIWPSLDDPWRRYEGIENYDQYVETLFWDSRWWILAVGALAAVLAALCYRRQLRYRVSRAERIGWPIFVFLFGVPGWVGYRYCRRWPPLEVCPACHQPAPRNDESCAVCDQEFPLPLVKGTEIFV